MDANQLRGDADSLRRRAHDLDDAARAQGRAA